MAGWEESADRPVLAGQVLRPGDIFPPPPPEPEHRRWPRWPIWVAVAVVLAIGAGVVAYARSRPTAPSSADQVAAVRRAYLAWWGAAKQAYLHLDPSPMRKYMTDAGFRRASQLLAPQQQADQPVDFEVPSHDLLVTVYRSSDYASVDDIWKSNNVTVDPVDHAPTSQPSGDRVEESTTLKNVNGKWLLDDMGIFGASSDAVSGTAISYATLPGDQPSPEVRTELVAAFRDFIEVRAAAYLRLDSGPLATVEGQPYLGVDLQHMDGQRAKQEPFQYLQQDSYRIGIQDATHAWLYDTLLDESDALNGNTLRPLRAAEPHVYRLAYTLTKGAGGWVVTAVGGA